DEHMAHPLRVSLVHGEAFAAPVTGTTEALELLDDDAAVLVLPVRDTLEELHASQVAAAYALAGAKFALHFRLGCDPRVGGPGEPKHFLALLAGTAGKHVLQRVVQDMAEMEDAGDVGRRDDDRVTVLRGGRIGFEAFPVDPG